VIIEISNVTESPFIRAAIRPCFPHRISTAKGQNEVNEANPIWPYFRVACAICPRIGNGRAHH
jgi:hypothetical protein